MVFTDNFIILDSGTAPSPRGLIAYDLRSRAKAFADIYSAPVTEEGDILSYWVSAGGQVGPGTCAAAGSQGSGSISQMKVTLDLSTLVKKPAGEYRCGAAAVAPQRLYAIL